MADSTPRFDREVKAPLYARYGIPEYWIVDPKNQQVTVLTLSNGAYATHAERQVTGMVGSALLANFQVDVSAMFSAAGQRP